RGNGPGFGEAGGGRTKRAMAVTARHTEPGPAAEGPFSARPFVGRVGELSELRGALADAMAGLGRLMLVLGEPGIGKTRTAEEVGRLASSQGALVLWGSCPEDLRAPAFWPWIQVLRGLVGVVPPKEVDRLGGRELLHLVPELTGRGGSRSSASRDLPSEQAARFRLFDAVSRL